MGLNVFLITDYTSTWRHIHLFASSAWLDFDMQGVCVSVPGVSLSESSGYECSWDSRNCVYVCLHSKRSRDFLCVKMGMCS